MIIVSNTSPISNLAAIGQLTLLQQLYGNLFIPPKVYQEILACGSTDPGTLALQTVDWIQVISVTNFDLVDTLQKILDPGEAEAIALAVELNADRLIIDERKGRNEAIKSRLQVTGLLGIVLAAKQKGIIPLVKPILDDLTANGFWIRKPLCAEILSIAGE
jgi:predicted nucleic acid-binding protein